jgi:Raf kinase inhibitor-like YbhB/YbcL family protein
MKRILFVVACVACKDAGVSPSPANGTTVMSVTITSASFAANAPIPVDHTCDGADQSPQLSWTSMPGTTRSIAVVLDDPDAPSGTFTHWLLWNVAAETRTLPPGAMGGGMAGTNDFGKVGYNGPCPPKGKLHHYRFNVYGLDTILKLKATDKRSDLDTALHGHVVAQGMLAGTFEH